MTLAEIASYVCSKVGKSDSVTLALCKDFIRARYRMIFDSQLWRESLGLYTATASSDQLIMPIWMDRVIAVRWNSREMIPVDQETLFQVSPQVFETIGTPYNFSLMQPVATASMPNVTKPLAIQTDDQVNSENVFIRGQESGYDQSETIATIPGAQSLNSQNQYDVIFSITRAQPATSTLTVFQPGTVNGATSTLFPGQTSVQYLRIRLHEIPKDTTKPLLVLGKRKFQPLISDLDAPEIRGIDNALIAFALCDLLERQRQYAKAQMKLQEAEAQIKIALGLETAQGAALPRIIPWVGENDSFVTDGFEPWYLAKS